MTSDTINDAQTVAGSGEGPLLAGRYRVVRRLGQGGMGSVWLVEDTQLDDMPFAVKMLPSILVSNKRAYAQLKAEALVSLKLVHPNIVMLRAFEENDGNPFLVMDYVDGQTLDDYLAERGAMSEEDALRILKPVAAALDYAHTQGVVHRDVKPANVMIRKDGHPFILDFGIAREIQETLTRVTGKLSSGTLLYMSPEQLNGERPKKEQDIYSFAAMVYECLKGEPPFVRGQIEHQILHCLPLPLPDGPRSCATAVMAGLAKRPEDRPKSCAAVLKECVASHLDDPPPDNPQERDMPHGGAWKVFAIVAALGLAAFGGWWWRYGKRQVVQSAQPLPDSGTNTVVIVGNGTNTVTTVPPGPQTGNGTNEVKKGTMGTPKPEPLPLPPVVSNATPTASGSVSNGFATASNVWTVTTNFVFFEAQKRRCMTVMSPDKTELRLMWCGDKTNGFWMGETEVTRKQWRSFMLPKATDVDANGPDDDPLANVRYEQCRMFVEKLHEATGLHFSLPDTNSWQIACLAGRKSKYWWGDDCIEQVEGNFRTGESDYDGKAKQVKSYHANAWGLYDTHGNVAEWCAGRYIGGGNYANDETDCTAESFRKGPDSDYKNELTGFRVFLKEIKP